MQTVEKFCCGSVFTFWRDINPDVQAALIGNVGITLVALLTIIGTALVATRQFSHERMEKAKDRALELKKELLVEGIRGASLALSSIGQISSVERDVALISSDFQEGMRRMTEASAVANIATVSAGTALTEKLGPAFIRSLARRISVETNYHKLTVLQGQFDELIADASRINELVRQQLVDGDIEKVKMLQAQGGFIQKHIEDCNRDLREVRENLRVQRPALGDFVLNQQISLSADLRKLIARVRQDIGVDGDEEQYMKASRIDEVRARSIYKEAIAELEAEEQSAGGGSSEGDGISHRL